ncbi:MAG: hypothetical protein ACRD8W_20445 [Nitrososphaeraceae archaeon]
MKVFTILTAIAMSLSMIFYSTDVVLGEPSSRKNITIVFLPINEPDDDIKNSFSEEFAELIRSTKS